jgi:hypothetical protein
MDKGKAAREQQIAVFGESGSGKTVLISSFYGSALEPHFMKDSLFNVVADDAAQSVQLHQNYLGMRDSANLPMGTRFSTTPYAFSVKRKESAPHAKQSRSPETLRLIWHDYPGEWFSREPDGADETQRRLDTFRSLLGSDVALLLVDAQKLLDNAGDEERYLKSLFTNFRIRLQNLKEDLLVEGKPLVRFPRIWMMALSKSDLLPDLDVIGFRDLVIGKAGGELVELRNALASLVESNDALSVGEDFVLLSSAKFEPGKIEVAERIGLDLLLPIAAMLPFSRHVKWAKAMHKGGEVAEELMNKVRPLATLIGGRIKFSGPLGAAVAFLGPHIADIASKMVGDKLVDLNRTATIKRDFLTATLTGFQLKLDRAVDELVLLRSLK